MHEMWEPKTMTGNRYFGQVYVQYSDSVQSSPLHLFVSETSFLNELELDFGKSLTGAKTFFFLQETSDWMPQHVVQLDRSKSNTDYKVISFETLLYRSSDSFKWPQRNDIFANREVNPYT
jgi:hypothetical protein